MSKVYSSLHSVLIINSWRQGRETLEGIRVVCLGAGFARKMLQVVTTAATAGALQV
ncbi:hypothetical protein ABKV19_016647 [Rosa sericea]